MRLLDLFAGAGGASVGYYRAGFEVVGVDIKPQPNFPFAFVQSDALEWADFDRFDLIHASPPCQAYSPLRHSPGAGDYPDLVLLTRNLLQAADVPYVIENVPGAPLLNPVTLCGSAFNLRHQDFELRRHRLFETSFPLIVPPCDHRDPVLGVYGDLSKNRRPSTRGVKAGIADAEALMGIDWMTVDEMTEAVPPAYTQFIGEQFLAQRRAA